MTLVITRTIVVYLSLLVLFLAILFPKLYILQILILTPIYISSALFIGTALLIFRIIQLDRQHIPSSSLPPNRNKHALRPLRFTTPAAWSAVLTRQSWEDNPSSFAPIHKNASSSVNSRLDSLFLLIKRHFILPWYERISPSPAFPHAVERMIRHISSDFTNRAEQVDWPNIMVSRILPIVSDHIQHYRSIEHLSSSSASAVPNPALPLPLPRKSHPALSSQPHTSSGISPSIETHLRETLARILGHSMLEKDKSEVVLTIVREIVLGAALLPIFKMLCDSDFWNRQIDEKGGKYLREQKQVDKFLSALSALPAPTPSNTSTPLPTSKTRKGQTQHIQPPSSTSISAESSSKQFDNFLRSIGKLKSLGDARRLRADVERELRSAKLVLAEETRQERSVKEGDKRFRRAEKYVRRLERAKSDIDARIAVLSGQPGKILAPLDKSPLQSSIFETKSDHSVSLYSILSDPSSLAYWLEYMERRGRSRLVQYWLTVEGFKDPLEAAGLDSALNSTVQTIDQKPSDSNQTIGEDIAFLYEMYFAVGQNEITIPSRFQQVIEDTAQSYSPSLSASEVQKVKHAVFASQKEVYEQMAEEDWPRFKKSELFVKALTDIKRAGIPLSSNPELEASRIASPKIHSTPMTLPPITRPPATPAPSSKSLLDLLSPSARPRQTNKRGSFSPTMTPTPTASISFTPPIFQRSPTADSWGPQIRDIQKVGFVDIDKTLSIQSSGPSTPPPPVRRSSHLDFLISEGEMKEEIEDRGKLFDEEDGIDEHNEDYVEAQRIEAIQAALNEIIASDDMVASRHEENDRNVLPHPQVRSPSASLVFFDKSSRAESNPPKLTSKSAENLKASRPAPSNHSAPPSRLPSVAVPKVKSLTRRRSNPRLSMSPDQSSRHLFDDELIDEDEALIDEEDINDPNEKIQLAAPGDLRLSVEIARLQDKIQELVQQDHLLDTLIRQAELTGNQAELRILRRSQSSVRREQRTAIFQKAQFEQQEEENRLVPGRTSVCIPSSVVSSDPGDNGKQVVKYTIEISQAGEDGQIMLGWVVARRYNEFYELDKSLREWAAGMGEHHTLGEELKKKVVEMPGKKLVPNLSVSFVESRRAGLERYLQSLLTSSIICDSMLLRSFLSRSPMALQPGSEAQMSSSTASLASLAPHNIVKSLYKTMATSIDDALLGPSMLDMMYSTLSRQLNDFGGMVGLGGDDLAGLLPSALKGGPYTPQWLRNDPIAAASATATSGGRIGPMGGESGMTSFTAPICDLFIEVFDLKENNWLRRQAIVVILQQFLGSTIERKARDSFRAATSSESIERILSSLEETIFPEGERRPTSVERTEQEKLETKIRASKKLGSLIPDVAANMIGRGNARRAARRVFGALQDTRLNQHLVLSIMDEILNAMFPPPR
ncbi:uncharacterized protein IL334_001175 [Kwoniella shivajii]|uniref:Intermediate filament protein n=1 Tax=Kwoniella shivajii TaxID=564305 RepID=A0ABZ1CSA8_9TREE|nr:hypothetical protein IL334_001175 [Kwoniella shivajii]